MATHAGDRVKLTMNVNDRQCFFAQTGKPGGPVLSFPAGSLFTAATDELGGNIFAKATSGADAVLVPFGEGEWVPA
jgi:hypothetical protein